MAERELMLSRAQRWAVGRPPSPLWRSHSCRAASCNAPRGAVRTRQHRNLRHGGAVVGDQCPVTRKSGLVPFKAARSLVLPLELARSRFAGWWYFDTTETHAGFESWLE
jgi:hypothetical protein